ncbi:DNA replication licensing factor MCM8 [Gorgonomyces haynaldii]|nr:DNA replication licensing factor MCM8 [Gorgonomyces haynaldii]
MSRFDYWDDFFDYPYTQDDELVPIVFTMMSFFDAYFASMSEYVQEDEMEMILSCGILLLDYDDLKQVQIPDFLNRLQNEPQKMFNTLGVSASQAASKCRVKMGLNIPGKTYKPMIVRIANCPHSVSLKEVKSQLVGRWVTIQGTVVRVSQVKPLISKLAFTCQKCQAEQTLVLAEGKIKMPERCGRGCKSKQFLPQLNSQSTVSVDYQKIRIQEKLTDDQVDSGRIPRSIEVELLEDLVDTVVPGDVVVVSGIVKLQLSESKNTQLYTLYIDGNFIGKAGSQNDDVPSLETSSKDAMLFSERDLFGIREIHSQPNVFNLLVHSLCPTIYGHEMVKAGLLLVLFGGRQREQEESMRSNPHILVVGDPGLGKSQLLVSTVKLAPRGVYVCGNTTTNSGLTVTVSKDSSTGDTCLEAGALVLGDQGVCCIDEFDKMNDHQALLEAMEQQSISVAKASIVCTLPARASIIAAANPHGGHYNKQKTVSENLRMSGALLSRFDLVFILLDKADQTMDKFLSNHIMKIHQKHHSSRQLEEDEIQDPDYKALFDRLKQQNDIEPIPPTLLRKYIAYSRQYTKPRLSPEAKQVLQHFYITLRTKYRSPDATPITTRQLESMIRLSEARARCELRDIVTDDDAKDVVELMKFSLWDSYQDAEGNLDFQRSQHGSSTSKRGATKKLVAELQKYKQNTGNTIFTMDSLNILHEKLHIKENLRDLVEGLNHEGLLINTRLFGQKRTRCL